uniref:eukaryotic translation initiation factor 5B-like n=1 Tax=Ciona intestinalis TaxID=7719 RepID=UPI000180CD0B|nr:eukaryotic translation initiation factor 5B-like [Ciona intestinalis]|eukprot:XP_002127409.1 eukaryotic translation initiation factor 5B-like [Ciona intestinalis]
MGKKKGKGSDSKPSQPTDGEPNVTGGKKSRKKQDDNWEDDVLNEIAVMAGGDEPASKAESVKPDATKKENEPQKTAEQTTPATENAEPVVEKKKNKKKDKKGNKNAQTKPVTSDKTDEQKTENDSESKNKADDAKPDAEEQAEGTQSNKSKKKKKAKQAEEEKAKKGKPNKAMLKVIQETLKKKKEEEERLQRIEDERIKKEEDAEKARLHALELIRLKKEKKKQDKKDKILRLKQEGKYLTPTQREQQKRRQAYLESLKQQGIAIPEKGTEEKMKKPRYEKKKKVKQVEQKSDEPEAEDEEVVEEEPFEIIDVEGDEELVEEEEEEEEEDLGWEAWDDAPVDEEKKDEEVEEDSESDEEEESESEEEEPVVEHEKNMSSKEKVKLRLEKQRKQYENEKSIKDLRSPIICVMGHVDTGKTKILDKIRHTNVQDGEAGGITQQIGATNIPVNAILEQTKMVKDRKEIQLPGLLVIDTPGHESFSNLRSRGSSNCDMAILVVDIMHGLEPQTIESINMLKKKKTPFVVALNKIDRLYEWKSQPKMDITNCIQSQKKNVMNELTEKVNGVIVQFAEQGLNVKLYYENEDPKHWISMIPTSAISGDGMGNLMALVVQLCQTVLVKRLMYSEQLQCTVLEVKAIQGLGTTIDVILTNGRLKYGDTIVVPGVEGPIVTHVKGLLMPEPLKELRVKNPYTKYSEVKAAQGIKILAKDLDKAMAGASLLVARGEEEIEICKEEVQAEVNEALKAIKLQERGVFVQASTLGSLEALLEFLKQSKIPYAGIGIGPVHRKDIMKASVMLEHDDQWAVILAFDVKVEREAQEIAENLGVKIFTADIIYHLFDAFMQHREDLKKRKQDEFRQVAVFPCKIRIAPNCVFKSRDPIIIGVQVESGQLRVGTPICAQLPSGEILPVGIVASMEFNHKPIEIARKPQEVCIKIEGTPGEAPKMVGRHFGEKDLLMSKINRDSINALKDWFRDDMTKNDWQLIIELKKLYEII